MENNRYKTSAKRKKLSVIANKHINFVVVVYILLMAYILFVMYHSLTKEQLHIVYAEAGEILNESVFDGVLVRNEHVVYSEDSGPVKYFIPEGDKVRLDAYVAVVNQDEETARILETQVNDHLNQLSRATAYTDEAYRILKERIRSYVVEKKKNNYSYVAVARDNLETTLYDLSQTVRVTDQTLFNQIQDKLQENQDQKFQNGSYYTMEKSGVISYTMDGFEEYNINNLDTSMFTRQVSAVDITRKQEILKGDPLYKVVDNYLFYLVSEIDPYSEKHLENRSYVSLFFPTKNTSVDVKVHSTFRENDKIFAVYEIERYFDMFFTDRNITYKIVYNKYEGLKIPNEAITTKEVYKVPRSAIEYSKGRYIVKKNEFTGTLQKNPNKDKFLVPIEVKEYYVDGEYAYIRNINSENALHSNDRIFYTVDQIADDDHTEGNQVGKDFVLEEPVLLEGVYVVNKGYTDFRRIETIYEDVDFRIIQSPLRYSVGLYDKIIADSRGIKEFTTIK